MNTDNNNRLKEIQSEKIRYEDLMDKSESISDCLIYQDKLDCLIREEKELLGRYHV